MRPYFIAVEKFGPSDPESWSAWVARGTRFEEVVTLDHHLCPSVLNQILDEDWAYIVNEDFMLSFFLDLPHLLGRIVGIPHRDVLACYRNPINETIVAPDGFEFVGYDLVDKCVEISALTNCGGFPDVFTESELSSKGLLTSYERAKVVQRKLQQTYPSEFHADCDLWAIFRAPSL